MLLTINKKKEAQWTNDGINEEYNLHHARLAGSLDEHTVSHLRELSDIVFDENKFSVGDHFLIDLSDVTEIDHVGLAALVGIIVTLAAKAGSLALIFPENHPVRTALRITGLDKFFEVHETPEAADKIVLELRRIQHKDS